MDWIFLNGPSSASFSFILSFQTIITIVKTNKCERCYVHPVYRTGIQTHYLQNTSLLP